MSLFSSWKPSGKRPAPFEPSTIFDRLDPAVAAQMLADRVSAFDACQVGVVLRAMLFVHAVLAAGALFVARSWGEWSLLLSRGAAVAVPAVLLWLVVGCAFKRPLDRLPDWAQWAVASVLGAVAGGYGWWLLSFAGATPGGERTAVPAAVAGALFAAAIFYVLRLRARGQLPAVTTARLTELQARIRPHFLFNTLNTAIALVRVDPARAERVLEDLSELFRVALHETGAQVTLDEEVELARSYLAIEQIRFGSRLQVEWDIDDAAGGAKLPPLVLQPLVENAVKHGIEPAPEGGRILIQTRSHRGHAVVTVTNTVPPGGKAALRHGNGLALKNVRERLRLLHDVAARFQAGPKDGVFKARIEVPL